MAIDNKNRKLQGSDGTSSRPKKAIRQLKKEKKIPLIQDMERFVLQCIIGQDKEVRRIITAIYRSIHLSSIKTNLLIIGKSGTGKTETLKQIAKRLKIPYTIEDATKYTKEGYYGSSVENMIENLLEAADYDVEKAQNGMIIIDEIDKKAGKDSSDVAGVEVLKSLLKLVEGSDFNTMYGECFDTRNLIIVFCGAFFGIEKIRAKRLKQNTIGFRLVEEQDKKNKGYTREDLVEYGMPEEFVGRIGTIVEMNSLKKEDLVQILKRSKLSIFKKYQSELKKAGITLYYNRKLFELIADKSLELDTGARGLDNEVNYIFEDMIYYIMSNPGKYSKCKMELEIVNDNTKYELS